MLCGQPHQAKWSAGWKRSWKRSYFAPRRETWVAQTPSTRGTLKKSPNKILEFHISFRNLIKIKIFEILKLKNSEIPIVLISAYLTYHGNCDKHGDPDVLILGDKRGQQILCRDICQDCIGARARKNMSRQDKIRPNFVIRSINLRHSQSITLWRKLVLKRHTQK